MKRKISAKSCWNRYYDGGHLSQPKIKSILQLDLVLPAHRQARNSKTMIVKLLGSRREFPHR